MILTCTCPDDGAVCLGEGYPTDPGTCRVCAERDGEQHCPKCPCCGPVAQLEECLEDIRNDEEDDIDFTELTDHELTQALSVAVTYALDRAHLGQARELATYIGLIEAELAGRGD